MRSPPTDVLAAEKLGADQDKAPFKPKFTPWAPGDEPHWESVNLDEVPVEVLKMKICRSFRADLQHKLTVIIRAFGGYGHNGMWDGAKRLGVCRATFSRWFHWHTYPGRPDLEKIDTVYVESIQILVAKELKRRDKRAKQKAATQRRSEKFEKAINEAADQYERQLAQK